VKSLLNAFLALMITVPAFGATRTWIGVIDLRWSNGVNWDGGVPASGDDVVIRTIASTNNDLPAGLQLRSVTLVDGSSISGNAVVLGTGGFSTTGTVRTHWQEDTRLGFSTLTLGASQTWTNPAGIPYVEFGEVDLNGKTLTLNIAPFTFLESIRGGGTLVIQTGKGPTLQNSDGQALLVASADSRNAVIVNNGFLQILSGSVGPAQVNGGMLFLDHVALGSITMNGGELWLDPQQSFTDNLIFTESTNTVPTVDVPIDRTVVQGAYKGRVGSIEVSSTVNLGNAMLRLEPFDLVYSFDPLTIIHNQGSAPTSGTFLGLPEGAIINSPWESFLLSYTGGDGNDVTITHIANHPNSTTTVTSSANPSRLGQVTLTATVGPAGSSRPQGSVNFYDGGVLLGRSTLDGSGHAILDVKLSGGTRNITAAYTGSQSFAVSRGTLQLKVQQFRSRAARP
jgi:hypothetical protein